MSLSTSASICNRSQGRTQQSAGSDESIWTDEYAICEEPNFKGNMLSFEKLRNTPPFQRPSAQAESILSTEIRVAQCSDNARPHQDREETRQRMLKEELSDLQEALNHEKRINRGTAKLQGQTRSQLESQDYGGWDEIFEVCVW